MRGEEGGQTEVLLLSQVEILARAKAVAEEELLVVAMWFESLESAGFKISELRWPISSDLLELICCGSSSRAHLLEIHC